MSRSYADLPLHYGQVPPWLYQRMSKMGVAIVEAIMAWPDGITGTHPPWHLL